MTDILKIDVWSDIACPWCYVGKRRFKEGVRRYHEQGGDQTVQVEYHSFELAPDTPVDFQGSEVDFLAGYKGIPVAQVRQMLAQMTEVAASVGLTYDFDALQHTNTRKAHQVLHLAKAHGLQPEMKEHLLRAYFVEGATSAMTRTSPTSPPTSAWTGRWPSPRSARAPTPTTSTPTSARGGRTASQAYRSSSSTSGTASRERRTPTCSRGLWRNRQTTHRYSHDRRRSCPWPCDAGRPRRAGVPGRSLPAPRRGRRARPDG
jgi:hypothetical protein